MSQSKDGATVLGPFHRSLAIDPTGSVLNTIRPHTQSACQLLSSLLDSNPSAPCLLFEEPSGVAEETHGPRVCSPDSAPASPFSTASEDLVRAIAGVRRDIPEQEDNQLDPSILRTVELGRPATPAQHSELIPEHQHPGERWTPSGQQPLAPQGPVLPALSEQPEGPPADSVAKSEMLSVNASLLAGNSSGTSTGPAHCAKAVCGKRPKMEDTYAVQTNFFDLPISPSAEDAENKLPARIALQLEQFDASPNNSVPMSPTMGSDDPSMAAPASNSSESCDTLHFFGVYDGHGGIEAAQHCATRLHRHLSEALANICGILLAEGGHVQCVGEQAPACQAEWTLCSNCAIEGVPESLTCGCCSSDIQQTVPECHDLPLLSSAFGLSEPAVSHASVSSKQSINRPAAAAVAICVPHTLQNPHHTVASTSACHTVHQDTGSVLQASKLTLTATGVQQPHSLQVQLDTQSAQVATDSELPPRDSSGTASSCAPAEPPISPSRVLIHRDSSSSASSHSSNHTTATSPHGAAADPDQGMCDDLTNSEGSASSRDGLSVSSLLEEALKEAFMKTDTEFAADGSSSMVGTTAVVALIGSKKMWIANCGDSRAVLCRGGKAVQLTDDHKPEREDEAERVEKAGGQVLYYNGHRVMGVLAMSRAIGDHGLRPYVIAEPEITVMCRNDDDDFLLLASDGLWDVMQNQEATALAARCLKRARDKGASRKAAVRVAANILTKAAIDRGSKDNVTVVIVDLKSPGADDNSGADAAEASEAGPSEDAVAAAPVNAQPPTASVSLEQPQREITAPVQLQRELETSALQPEPTVILTGMQTGTANPLQNRQEEHATQQRQVHDKPATVQQQAEQLAEGIAN